MAQTFKALADGQLPNSRTALYTVPSSTSAVVRSIILCNTGGGTESVILYVDVSGSPRKVAVLDLSAGETAHILDGGQSIILEDGDTLQGETTTATTVDYYVGGVEVT